MIFIKRITVDTFNEVIKSINTYGRPLEKAIMNNYFFKGDKEDLINELKKYQNEDGGFGHGIESDFRLPYSSPMATSVGVRILSEFDYISEAKEMIKLAINYFETSFDKERNGWFVSPREINDFPHAPWWHFNEEEGMTVIDKNWGNPSAEIIAYLYKYKEYTKKLDIDSLVEYAINYIENKEKFNSENEIYCYIKLYEVLPNELKNRLKENISEAIEEVIVYDEKRWAEYVPKPLDFVNSKEKYKFGIEEYKINKNLDFIIDELERNKKILPPWGESFYNGDLKIAYNEWIGVITLKDLLILDKYDRIEIL